jgi:hypothetical protein
MTKPTKSSISEINGNGRGVPSERTQVRREVLEDSKTLIDIAPRQRRSGQSLMTFAYSLHLVSPRAYRYVREVLPLSSPPTVST